LIGRSDGAPVGASVGSGEGAERASNERAFLLGEAMVPGHGHGPGAFARNGDSRGRRGGQFIAG